MKYAVIALISAAAAYDEAEGPTKADNGDSDFSVVYRESDIKNGEKFSGWTNPLGWTDNGADDDTVVTQLEAQINYPAIDISDAPHKHVALTQEEKDINVSQYDADESFKFHDFTGVQIGTLMNKLKKNKNKDEFDHDTNTVSEYDAGHQFEVGDYGVPAEPEAFEGVMFRKQGSGSGKDNYDGDKNTVSQYDHMKIYRRGDYGVPEGQEGAYKPPTLAQRMFRTKVTYDRDTNTVSQYDDMPHYEKFDWGVPEGEEGHWEPEALMQRRVYHKDVLDGDKNTVSDYDYLPFVHSRAKPFAVTGLYQRGVRDTYDRDSNTVSQYDDMPHYEKFDWGVPEGEEGHWEPEALVQKKVAKQTKRAHHHRKH